MKRKTAADKKRSAASRKKRRVDHARPTPDQRRRGMVRERADSWYSALGGLGGRSDKRKYMAYVADPTNWAENAELWRGDDLAGRIVEMIPNEMIREGWTLCIEKDDKGLSGKVVSLLEDLGCDNKLWMGLCMERAYGGGGVLLGTNDGDDLRKPLDLKKITALNYLETFEPQELQVVKYQNDPTKKGFGQPVMYRLNPQSPGGSTKYGVEIHASRIVVFPGIRVSRRQITTQSGWGDAVLTRCRETLRDFQTSWAAAGLLVADFAQAVWKIKGLAEIIALDKDKELHARIDAMTLAQSTVRATVIDADGEEYERKQTPVNGLPELLDRFATRLAASADTPVTLLMGMSPAGLNATGESDIRTWYDRVKSMQNRKLRPAIERIVRVAFAALGVEEPEDWSIEFNPLWQPNEQEQAQARLTQMQVDVGYIDAQVISTQEVRKARFGGRKYSFDTPIDHEMPVPPPVEEVEQDPQYADFKQRALARKPEVRAQPAPEAAEATA